MTNLRNYIQEITERVEGGKKAGRSVADLQETITVASLKSLNSEGYAEFLAERAGPGVSLAAFLQSSVNGNVGQIYERLDKV